MTRVPLTDGLTVGVAVCRFPDLDKAEQALVPLRTLIDQEPRAVSALRYADPPVTETSPGYIAVLAYDEDDGLLDRLAAALARLGGTPYEPDAEVALALALRHFDNTSSGRKSSHLRFGSRGAEMDSAGRYVRNQG